MTELESEVQTLAKEAGYDSIRISLNPTKQCTVQGVLEDLSAYLKARKTGEGITHLWTVSI